MHDEQIRHLQASIVATLHVLTRAGLTNPEEWKQLVARAKVEVEQEEARQREEWRTANPADAKAVDFMEQLMGLRR